MIKTSKICKECNNSKYLGSKDKLFCPFCKNQKRKKAYSLNVENARQKARDYRKQNIDRVKQRNKIYRNNNREYILNRRREYYKKNPERFINERENIHPLYSTWDSMKQRCYNSNNKAYKDYGGRGIRVCDRWRISFNHFVEDMGDKPGKNYSLERLNNQGNYEPGNCKWATKKEQQSNTRRTRLHKASISDNSPIYYPFGSLITLKEFAEKVNLPLIIAKYRYAQNCEWENILSNNYDNRYYEYKGHMYNMTELSIISGISFQTLSQRIRYRNWSIERAVQTSIKI